MHEQLDPVGLVHMNGRVYDPELGRFMSPDIVIQDVTNLQSLNAYSYVLNNPLSLTDPSGYFFSGLIKAIKGFFKAIFKAIGLTAPIILPDVVMLLDRSSWTSPLPKGDKLILGDPDLSKQSEWVFEPIPKSGEEADEIALREGAVALKGAGANRAAVMQFFSEKGKGANLLYFATHGMSDEDNPMDESFLALSDGHLFGSDIKKLQLKGHPLVVMSACQTALGKVFASSVWRGRGVTLALRRC